MLALYIAGDTITQPAVANDHHLKGDESKPHLLQFFNNFHIGFNHIEAVIIFSL